MEHDFYNDLIVLLYEPSGHRSFMMWKYDHFGYELSKWFGDKEGWNQNSLNFRGYPAKGIWKIHIADYYKENIGNLKGLKLNIKTFK